MEQVVRDLSGRQGLRLLPGAIGQVHSTEGGQHFCFNARILMPDQGEGAEIQ